LPSDPLLPLLPLPHEKDGFYRRTQIVFTLTPSVVCIYERGVVKIAMRSYQRLFLPLIASLMLMGASVEARGSGCSKLIATAFILCVVGCEGADTTYQAVDDEFGGQDTEVYNQEDGVFEDDLRLVPDEKSATPEESLREQPK